MSRYLSQRQHATWFCPPTETGATVGYLCVVTQIRGGNRIGWPRKFDDWCYRIFVPALRRFITAKGSELIPGDCCDLRPLPTEDVPSLQIQFHHCDETKAVGMFCLDGISWSLFVFRHEEIPVPLFEWRLSTNSKQKPGRLIYAVPQGIRIERRLIRQTLEEMFQASTETIV